MVWPTAALRCSQHNFFAGVVVTQAVKLVKEGWAPIFGGDANLARWAVELDCFWARQLQILWPLDTMPQRRGQLHVSGESLDRIHHKRTKPGGRVSAVGAAGTKSHLLGRRESYLLSQVGPDPHDIHMALHVLTKRHDQSSSTWGLFTINLSFFDGLEASYVKLYWRTINAIILYFWGKHPPSYALLACHLLPSHKSLD